MTDLTPPHTVDAFLGGSVEALQPKRGHHRSGLEAVLLAAALPVGIDGTVVDLGAGAGVAGLCAAALHERIKVVLVEREAELVATARMALALPQNASFGARMTIAEVDINAPEQVRSAAGLPRGEAAVVLTNPPFHPSSSVRPPPAAARAAAHVLPENYDPWFRAAASALRPEGLMVAVTLPAALPELFAALAGRFGAVAVLPTHARPNDPAHRLLIAARKGRKAPPMILPGLVLHDGPESSFAPKVDALLRGRAMLSEIHPPWRKAVGGGI